MHEALNFNHGPSSVSEQLTQNFVRIADLPISQRMCNDALRSGMLLLLGGVGSLCQPPIGLQEPSRLAAGGATWTGINCISRSVPLDTSLKYCEVHISCQFCQAQFDKTEPTVRRLHCFAACSLGSPYLTSRRSQLSSRKDSVYLSSPTGEYFTAVWLLDGELQLRGLRR